MVIIIYLIKNCVQRITLEQDPEVPNVTEGTYEMYETMGIQSAAILCSDHEITPIRWPRR